VIGLAAVLVGVSAADEATLARSALLRAEASRDTARLTTATVDTGDLALLARALGRTRDVAALGRVTVLVHSQDPRVRAAALDALTLLPGGDGAARDALGWLEDTEDRRLAWRAIGQQGGPADVVTALAALGGRDAAAAALALGRLATRGHADASAAPAVLEALAVGHASRTTALAYALYRLRPATLTERQQGILFEAYRRTASDSARAWLLAVGLPSLAGSARAEVLDDALNGPFPLARLAAVTAAAPADLDAASWEALASDEDGAVAWRARERLGRIPARTTAADRAEVADEATLAILLTDPDPVVVEAAADAVAAAPRSGLRDPLLGALRAAETEGVTRAVTEALVALHAARPSEVPAARRRGASSEVDLIAAALQRVAVDGPFRARQTAADALGLAPSPVLPAAPIDWSEAALLAPKAVAVDTTQGRFVIALHPEEAPVTASAFTALAAAGALDGTWVHRYVPGFVAQTGDPHGDGLGGPPWLLPDEPSATPFLAGDVGLARGGIDTGGSQWFVTLSLQAHLDGLYTRFGHVVSGLDVALRLDGDDQILQVRPLELSP
jgi:peptidyl-prolyl cis-trans isomerase B (cyclophilin B)